MNLNINIDNLLLSKNLRKPENEVGKVIGRLMNDMNYEMNKFTHECMKIKDEGHILEVGFSNGNFIFDILTVHKNLLFSGIDISEIMVQEAILKNSEFIKANRLILKVADSNNIPFANDMFDKTMIINTIYFWDEPENDLLEIKRVLKKGGKIYISFRSKKVMENFQFTKCNFNLYEPDEVKEKLQAVGFGTIIANTFRENKEGVNLDMICMEATKESI
jgi:ubiquinone/menaquinone biosynthesis C-methylase UbiE